MKILRFNESNSNFKLYFKKYKCDDYDIKILHKDIRYLDADLDDIEKNKIQYYLYEINNYIYLYFIKPSTALLKSTYYNSSYENMKQLKNYMLE